MDKLLLILNSSFVIELLSALIGGLIAFGIARYQIKKDKVASEQNGNEMKQQFIQELQESERRMIHFSENLLKNDKELELLKFKLIECNKAVDIVQSLYLNLANTEIELDNLMAECIDLSDNGEKFISDRGKFNDKLAIIQNQLSMLNTISSIVYPNSNLFKKTEHIQNIYIEVMTANKKTINPESFKKTTLRISEVLGELNIEFQRRKIEIANELINN